MQIHTKWSAGMYLRFYNCFGGLNPSEVAKRVKWLKLCNIQNRKQKNPKKSGQKRDKNILATDFQNAKKKMPVSEVLTLTLFFSGFLYCWASTLYKRCDAFLGVAIKNLGLIDKRYDEI